MNLSLLLDLYHAEIIQISAACGEFAQFNIYSTPQTRIKVPESRFSMVERTLCLDGQPVGTESSAKGALQTFISWLQKFDGQVVLIAHNGQKFDALHLLIRLQEHDLLDDFKVNVVGFIDSLVMFKNHFSLPPKSTGLKSLVKSIVPNFEYRAHDASEDVRALKKLLDSVDLKEKLFIDASFSLAYEIAYVEYLKNRNENEKSLQPLSNVISKDVKKKIAGSGLRYCDLQHAYQKAGRSGVQAVLSNTINGKPRVTKEQKIISKVCEHFSAQA